MMTRKWDDEELNLRVWEKGERISVNDPRLLQYIRDQVLIPPLSRDVPYKLADPRKQHFSQSQEQIIFLNESFGDSMTLFGGKAVGEMIPGKQGNNEVRNLVCFPLESLLGAIGQHNVDFFSLDIEGLDYDVLSNIPWDILNIQVFINCILLLCLGTILGFFLISYQLDNDQVESANGYFKTRYFFFRDWISSLTEVQVEKWNEEELRARIVENKEIIWGNDSRLLQYIRDHVLIPPSSRDVPYDLDDPKKLHYSQTGDQTRYLKKSFENFIGGFFIEAGAYGGERFSNTLWLEKEKNWTGLLIEPESNNFETLKRKQRKSWLAHSCLSPNPYPQMVLLALPPPPHSPDKKVLMVETNKGKRNEILKFMKDKKYRHVEKISYDDIFEKP
ncbi:unnamed protein product [Darwinula stevensoni]|uniref:Methyltransferase FkbM domain-containing protein n=1 Tax=Darwinula stevensoni TaxID=69355 RepID=A0A7R9AA78_9CRUS|nr:unnamed protein product [Darwinula stevensoni]CAG0898010.1 unnamed protein product [Darwinula stevensoni]